MYLGYMKRGISIMIGVVIATFVLLEISSSLGIILPVFFAFSFFDTWHIRNQTPEQMYIYKDRFLFDYDDNFGTNFGDIAKKHSKILGWGCIIFAVFLVINEIISPLIRTYFDFYYITGMFNSFIVAVLLVWLGIYLLSGSVKSVDITKSDDYVNYNGNGGIYNKGEMSTNVTNSENNTRAIYTPNDIGGESTNTQPMQAQNGVFTHNFMHEDIPQSAVPNVQAGDSAQVQNIQPQAQVAATDVTEKQDEQTPPITKKARKSTKNEQKSEEKSDEEWYNR